MSKRLDRMKTVRFILNDLSHAPSTASPSSAVSLIPSSPPSTTTTSSLSSSSSSSSSLHDDPHTDSNVVRISVPAKTRIGTLGAFFEEYLQIELPPEYVLYQLGTDTSGGGSVGSKVGSISRAFQSSFDSEYYDHMGNRGSASGGAGGSATGKRKRRLLKANDFVTSSRYHHIDDELIVRISPQLPPLQETMVFGVPIEKLATRPSFSTMNVRSSKNWKKLLHRGSLSSGNSAEQQPQLPEVLEQCFNFLDRCGGLDEVGIFRLSGSNRDLKQIIRQWNSGVVREFPPMASAHVVAGLVKQLLRELPDPLCTSELYGHFLQLFASETSQVERIVRLRELVHALPRANYIVLEHLMALLNKVSQRSEVNKMGLENLSIVIGPNILRSQGESSTADDDSMTIAQQLIGSATDTPKICQCCSTMIEHYSQIFDNPSPYDPALPGFLQLPETEKFTLDDRHQQQLVTASASESKRTPSRRSKSRTNVFHGYIPRSYYEPRHNENELQTTYASSQMRIGGESIVCLMETPDGLYVEREIPFDCVTRMHDVEDQYMQIDFASSKSDSSYIYISFEDDGADERLRWRRQMERVLRRYDGFKRLAQEHPELYGTILTRDELKSLRKKKLRQHRVSGSDSSSENLDKYVGRIQELEGELTAERQLRNNAELKVHELEEEIIDLRMQLEVARQRNMPAMAERDETDDEEQEIDQSDLHLSDVEDNADDDNDSDFDDGEELDSDSDDSVDFRF